MKNKSQINRLLKEIEDNSHKKIKVYTLQGCPACIELKDKFDKLGMIYEVVVMTDDLWDTISEMGGSEFVPQVQVEKYLIKEKEYTNINELIGKTLSNLLDRKIIIK